jgi:L-iditol 2-dehydrogenase
MKAIQYFGIKDLRLTDIPEPEPASDGIRLKVASVGICGSDVHYFNEGSTDGALIEEPFVLGHEFSALIDEGPNKGQLVAVDPAIACGECEFCVEGNPNFCTELIFAGSADSDGGLRERLYWPQKNLFPLPEGFTPQEGALLEPLGVAIHALRLGKILPGMSVGVLGAGPIGLLTVQMARLAGASRIFVTDRLSQRLEFAPEAGATDTLLADGSEAERILKATSGRGLDVVFEAAGDDGQAVTSAVQAAKRGGTVVLVGIPSEDHTEFPASAARRHGLTIKIARRMANTYPTAIRLVAQGQVDLNPLITHQYPVEEFDKAFQTATRREGQKVVINF